MAKLITVYWRDIPSQVMVRVGRDTSKVMLSQRFQEAIDRAAMRAAIYEAFCQPIDVREVPDPTPAADGVVEHRAALPEGRRQVVARRYAQSC